MCSKSSLVVFVAAAFAPRVASQCPAGYGSAASNSAKACGSNAASCTLTDCCMLNTGTCYAAGVVCGAGYYEDPSKKFASAGSTQTEKVANCCSAQATCADVTCPAGHEPKFSPPSSQKCAGAVSTCVGCCKATTGTCAAEGSNICDSGFYKDPLKHGNIAGDATARKTNCCTAKATCSDFWALANPTASGALKETPLSVAVVGATAAIISLM